MDLEKIVRSGYRFQNWSRTYECVPEFYFVPDGIDQIREILFLAKTEKKRVRVVGCGNSPSDICCSNDYMIDISRFNNVLHVDTNNSVVTVQAGINIHDLNRMLENNGLAIPVLGSISDSTLAGVISTGTHGTGYDTGIIADYVLAVRLITASGDIMNCSKQERQDIFLSVLCGLGALGIILEVTLQCQPKFYLHQLSIPSTLDAVLARLDEHVESCDHFRFLYFPHTDYVSVAFTNRVNGDFLNLDKLNIRPNGGRERPAPALAAGENGEWSTELSRYQLSSNCSWWQRAFDWLLNYGIGYHFIQLAYWVSTYVPALVPAINRFAFWALYSSNQVKLDVSYKVFNFECLFDQYVNEWAIPRNRTVPALQELKEAIDHSETFRAHFPIEVRFVRPSSIYLAPSHGRDSTYINIISYRPFGKHVDHQSYWQVYERIMKKNGGRPHWAKDHHETAQDLVRMYPFFRTWAQIQKRLDPERLFFNAYLDRIFSTYPAVMNASLTVSDHSTGYNQDILAPPKQFEK